MKLYVIKKYILAKNARQALIKERKAEADDIWVHEDWQKREIDSKFEEKKDVGFRKL